jgi:queuine tRNA-ribosyltransferase
MEPDDLKRVGATMVLANTFHLWERPGHERVAQLGGLHQMMGWDGPLLTDSGGYQVFSMADRVKLKEHGVQFRSPIDGRYRELTPELCVEIQEALGVDVAMALDECIPAEAERDAVVRSTARTTRWLHRCLTARRQPDRTALFGIVQGGMFADLREAHARELVALDLDGYAIGGLSVGEGQAQMLAMVDVAAPVLPRDKVRYLMGVGQPDDIAEAVARGIDLFDCVLPSRAGRHGQAYTWRGRLNVRNAQLAADVGPLDPEVVGSPANRYQRAYLRHLVQADEMLGARLLTLHNLAMYQQLMAELRAAIIAGDEAAFAQVRARAARAARPHGSVAAASQGG